MGTLSDDPTLVNRGGPTPHVRIHRPALYDGPHRYCAVCNDTMPTTVDRTDVPTPHFGRIECTGCGKFLGWQPKPPFDVPLRVALLVRLPFGMHRGMSLGELRQKDPSYWGWLVTTPKLTGSLRRAVDAILAADAAEVRP